MEEKKKHLYYLNELSDYKIDSDDPDVRGWKVKDVDNRVVGKVDNLLVSKEKKKVVYLDVEVDQSIIDANHDPYGSPASGDVHEFINKDGETHLILPIGLARLDLDEKYVYTDRINHRTFAETKRKAKGADVDRDYEVVVLESYNRDRDSDADLRAREGTGTFNQDVDELERKRRREDDNLSNERGTLRTDESSGTYKDRDRDRDRGRDLDDDSFYDRGEFDRDKYRR